MSTNAFIIGSGSYLPENVITNEALGGMLGLEAERIFKSSGIRSRHWANDNTSTSVLATSALLRALQDAGITAQDVDYLLCGTMTPDRFVPGSAATIEKAAGIRDVPCLDIRAACCNALYALQLASALVSVVVPHHVAICLAATQSPSPDLAAAP